MNRDKILTHEFVEHIPVELKEGTIYVSMTFATAAHKCVCGCGSEVITPLSPTDWRLTYDGVSVSLDPSIGNWSFACQSHYWIQRNTAQWAGRLSQPEIAAGRAHDRLAKRLYFNPTQTSAVQINDTSAGGSSEGDSEGGLWWKLKKLFF